MSIRTEQVASLIQRAVQDQLSRGLNDPRIRGMISVTKVTVSPDLADATIYVSVMPAEHTNLTLRGLQHAAAHLQRALARVIRLRRQPRLLFKVDDSMKHAAETLAAITEVVVTDRHAPPQAQTEGSGS